MKDIILRQEDIDRFSTVLSLLVTKSRILLSVLIHKDGHLLAVFGQADLADTTALSALVSANFASTQAVANLIGEKEFSTQFHVGKRRSVYISLIDDSTFLASVFDNSVNADTVKVYTQEYTEELAKCLGYLYRNVPDAELPELPIDETILATRAEVEVQAVQQSKKAAVQGAQARRLPHTGKQNVKKGTTTDTDVYYIDIPDDYYSHKARERSAPREKRN